MRDRVVVAYLKPFRSVGIFDADRCAMASVERLILILDAPIGREDGLEGKRPIRGIMGDILVLDNKLPARTIAVVIDAPTPGWIQIIPKSGNQVVRVGRCGNGIVGVIGTVTAEREIAVG